MTGSAALPPGRRETQRQNRRDRIVQVASQSFRDDGYAGTTMSGIAAKLGGSKATLWNYFPSKEELFVAVLDRMTKDFRAQLSLILSDDRDFEAVLRRFCDQFLRKATAVEGSGLFRLVIWENRRFPEIGRIFHDRGPRVTQEELTGFLQRAMDRGQLRDEDPSMAARHLVALCLAGSRQRLLMGLTDHVTPEDIARDIDEAMGVFMRAYAPS